jgi:energy-coupling factor transport system ATP-binding protein
VVGPSGSGKSTFGLAVAGLVPREIGGVVNGSLTVGGRETVEYGPGQLAGLVSVVFQDPAVQIVLERVEDDVAFGLENRAWPRDRMLARVPDALRAVGLEGLERRQARTLSGGQQQRLALAGAMAPTPGVLVLDEPTANLDPEGAPAFFERLGDLHRRRAATLVLVEHHVEAAWPLADVVLALGPGGEPIAAGTPDTVLRDHAADMSAAGIWLPTASDPGRHGGLRTARSHADPGRPILAARNVRFGYDPAVPVIRDVDFTAAEGERIALVGPNGGGKSTLGRLLVGLLRPRHGTVRLDGVDPGRIGSAALARLAGYVFQRPEQQFLAQRVDDEVMLGLRPDDRAQAAELMERLGLPLETYAERSPYQLSGGEQRRLSLACTLVRRPEVLVLDEPTFGQDRHGYEALLAILRDLLADGTCLIAATHDERFVRDVAERIVTLEDGWLVADEPATETRT